MSTVWGNFDLNQISLKSNPLIGWCLLYFRSHRTLLTAYPHKNVYISSKISWSREYPGVQPGTGTYKPSYALCPLELWCLSWMCSVFWSINLCSLQIHRGVVVFKELSAAICHMDIWWTECTGTERSDLDMWSDNVIEPGECSSVPIHVLCPCLCSSE